MACSLLSLGLQAAAAVAAAPPEPGKTAVASAVVEVPGWSDGPAQSKNGRLQARWTRLGDCSNAHGFAKPATMAADCSQPTYARGGVAADQFAIEIHRWRKLRYARATRGAEKLHKAAKVALEAQDGVRLGRMGKYTV